MTHPMSMAQVPPLDDALIRAFAATVKERLGLLQFDVWMTGSGDIELKTLIVPKEARKEGRGSKAVEKLTKLADVYGRRIILTPAVKDPHHGTTSRTRLVAFYKRSGFVENKGRHKDFTISAGMLREARPVRCDPILALPDEVPAISAGPGH